MELAYRPIVLTSGLLRIAVPMLFWLSSVYEACSSFLPDDLQDIYMKLELNRLTM
jgi:hypothetical protein